MAFLQLIDTAKYSRGCIFYYPKAGRGGKEEKAERDKEGKFKTSVSPNKLGKTGKNKHNNESDTKLSEAFNTNRTYVNEGRKINFLPFSTLIGAAKTVAFYV